MILFPKIGGCVRYWYVSWHVGMPYVVFSLLGVRVESQVRMKRFGIDIVVKNQGRHLRDGGEVEHPGEDDIKQIDSRGHFIPCEQDNRRLSKVNLSFSTQTRNIDG